VDYNGQPLKISPPDDDGELLRILQSYLFEAKNAREGGMNPRDLKWQQNIDLYWNRYDFSRKAAWQAKEVMPEVPMYVDRFAAAMKDALDSGPFYTIIDPFDQEDDLADAIKRIMDVWLTMVGRNQLNTPLNFSSVFEEQMKLGALMAAASVVVWKDDVAGGRVAIENMDPRFIWLDPTYRGLYRIRRTEIDKHELVNMARMTDNRGNPIFDTAKINELMTNIVAKDLAARQQLTGQTLQITSTRTVITLDEYMATVVAADGRVLADNQLIVVANEQFIIRGPEDNPYWHGRDWMTYAPLVTAPLSVYGRSYMEDFGSVAKTFTELTNLILDAVHATSMKAHVVVPSMLLDPTQANTGVHPGKTFLLDDGFDPKSFAAALDMGSLDAGGVQIWQAMKTELSQASGINEIGLGQFAPNSRTSATEVNSTMQNSSALVRSVAQTAESRIVNPLLDLVWKTGFQHVSKKDARFANAAGVPLWNALMSRRKELIKSPITFQANGISAVIQKGQMLQAIMQLMQVIGQNQNLMAAFMQKIDINKLLGLLFRLSNVDITQMEPSAREQLMQNAVAPLQQAAQNAQGPGGQLPPPQGPGADQMGNVAQMMGVAAPGPGAGPPQ
jgi:hypothetical protein